MDPFKQYFDKLIWFFVNKTLFSKLVNKSGSPINPATEDLQKEILNTLKGTEHLNPSDVSNPIVSAQNRTTKAVEELIIPEVDLKGLESKMDEFLRVLREKDLSVTVGKTEVNVDSKSIVSAIEKMTKNLPKMKESEIIDYTSKLDKFMKIVESQRTYSKELQEIKESILSLGKNEKLLKVISSLDSKYPFKFNKDGELIVEQGKQRIFFDHRNQNADGVYINPATEETLQSVLAASGKATNAYGYQAKSTTASYTYFFYEDASLNWYIMRKTIATGVMDYTKGTGGYASVYVDSTSAPSGSPTFASYGNTF